MISTGVSVKFLMVGESNSVVGYHLMAEDYWVLGCCESLPASPGQHPREELEFSEIFFLNIGLKRCLKS